MHNASSRVGAAAPKALAEESDGHSRRSFLRDTVTLSAALSIPPLLFELTSGWAAELPGPDPNSAVHTPKQATKLYAYPEPFMRDMRRRRIGDLLNALNLWQAGYHDLSFSPFTGGLIARTRFERVDELGYHSWFGRFDIDREGNSGRLDWFARNVLRQTLFYRQMAFVIATATARNSEYPKDFARQYESFARGAIVPDEATRNARISAEHTCYALIYIYARGPEDRVPQFSHRSPVEGFDHLQRAGIETGAASMQRSRVRRG